MSAARAIAEWRARVRAEYASAAVTAQVVHWGIVCGLPEPLLKTGLRVVGDELDHARLSHEVVVALGGEPTGEGVAFEAMVLPVPAEGLGAALIDAVLRSFCLGETLAVPLFAAMRADARHPVARAALDRVLRDEAAHRAFGWDALDALLELDAGGVRSRSAAVLPGMLDEVRRAYVEVPAHPPLTGEEREAGLISGDTYAAVATATLREELAPRFARRGIGCPERWP